MAKPRLDYDSIADTYDERYREERLAGVAAAIKGYCADASSGRVVEVGCGTGAWLEEIAESHDAMALHGLDVSWQMLLSARQKNQRLRLVNGSAEYMPYANSAFDLVICMNAIHHFSQPEVFIYDAYRILGDGGRILVMGMDPHTSDHAWYLYDYFESTRQIDLERFPPAAQMKLWLERAGFVEITQREVHRVEEDFSNNEVFENPFLQKHMISQLALISDKAYHNGLDLMRKEIADSEKTGEQVTFQVSIGLNLIAGRKEET